MKKESGIMLSELRDAQLPIIFKNAGFDFFIIDYEHGSFDYKDMFQLIMNARLVDIRVIVRLPNNQRKDITKIMDMGADGLLLPMTNDINDIAEVVEYAKYAPIGKRGISTVRAHSFYEPGEINSYLKKANERTKVYAQIETIKGVRNIESILSKEGVDGFFIGPNDLSSDIGVLGNQNSDEIKEIILSLGKVSIKLHKESGIITRNAAYLEKATQAGMNHYCVGSELSILRNGCKETVQLIHE